MHRIEITRTLLASSVLATMTRHIVKADLLDAMKESLRGLEDLNVLSANDPEIVRLKRSLKKTIAELEWEEFHQEGEGH